MMNQNYLHFNKEYQKQNDILAIGVPLAEIFAQHCEHNHIIDVLKKHHIIDYFIYVSDILISTPPTSRTLWQISTPH
jgi:hypothetical protein